MARARQRKSEGETSTSLHGYERKLLDRAA